MYMMEINLNEKKYLKQQISLSLRNVLKGPFTVERFSKTSAKSMQQTKTVCANLVEETILLNLILIDNKMM